jgi:predicted metal-dependent peptidase
MTKAKSRAGKTTKGATTADTTTATEAKPETRAKSELDAWLEAFIRDPGFLERYPYYAAILAKLLPVADPSVARMAVSLHGGRFFLHVNVESFMSEPQYLRGILLHEVHHVVLGHLTHPKFADVSEPELMDLAVEMSANEYIEEPLPSPIVWRAYAAAGIRAGQSTMERYERLVASLREHGARPRPAPGGGDGKGVDDHRFLRQGDRAPGGVTHTQKLVEQAVRETPRQRAGDAGDDEPRRFLLAGRTPGRLLEELTGSTTRPEHFVDWKTAIRMFVARARAPVHTYARPSRRFPANVGQIPGRTYAPRALVKPRILVAIDTSLSMTTMELHEIGRQLATLADHASLTIAECDVEVTRVYPFTGTLSDVAGRGGTDLRPVFAPEVLGAIKAEGVIYFTDGDGPTSPEPAPVPTLWVLTKPHAFACPWGERAWLGRGPIKRAPKPTKR